MRLSSFRVKKFRNIVDSGEIKVDPSVTCLVGKNEAGKSALIEALYLCNPAYGEKLDVNEHYPRWLVVKDRKAGSLEEHTPISVILDIEPSDKESVSAVLGDGVLTGDILTIGRKYGGGKTWSFQWDPKTALDNLTKKFPQNVVSLLSDIDDLEQLKTILAEATPVSDDENGLTDSELKTAHEIIAECGLKEAGMWEAIVNLLRPYLPSPDIS